jgi:hypothetical protein
MERDGEGRRREVVNLVIDDADGVGSPHLPRKIEPPGQPAVRTQIMNAKRSMQGSYLTSPFLG